jgi:hypothetical protein
VAITDVGWAIVRRWRDPIIVLPMTWNVFGAGLVGSFLGAAGGASGVVRRPSSESTSAIVRLPNGTMRNWHPNVVTLPRSQPVLVACRAHQTPWDHLVGHEAIAAQNGLGQPVPVLVGFMAIDRTADGIIAAVGVAPRLVLARPQPAWNEALDAWATAGLTLEVVSDVRPAQWEKAILNATVGPLCLATGLSVGGLWAEPTWRELAVAATAEGARIAQAAGIAVAPGLVARMEAFFQCIGAHRPSVLKDPGELPWIFGPLLAAARRHGTSCPALERIVALVTHEARLVGAGR